MRFPLTTRNFSEVIYIMGGMCGGLRESVGWSDPGSVETGSWEKKMRLHHEQVLREQIPEEGRSETNGELGWAVSVGIWAAHLRPG